jgi:histone H3/H4
MSTVETADADLPKALVKRIVKGKLAQVDLANGGDGSREFQINKDALLAFCESGKVFIHYLTATANDVCKEAKRQTISADDVITALEDLEFGELVPELKEALEGEQHGLHVFCFDWAGRCGAQGTDSRPSMLMMPCVHVIPF